MQRINLIFTVLFFLVTSSFCTGTDSMYLKAIPVVEPLVIEKRAARLTVNFVFDKVSSDYWMHYDKEKQELVFEFFGVHLGDSIPLVKGTDIINHLRVENGVTDLAFNRKISRLIFSLKPGWHCESWAIGGKTLRLSLWTNLDPGKKLGKKKSAVRYIVSAGTLAASTTLLLLIVFVLRD